MVYSMARRPPSTRLQLLLAVLLLLLQAAHTHGQLAFDAPLFQGVPVPVVRGGGRHGPPESNPPTEEVGAGTASAATAMTAPVASTVSGEETAPTSSAGVDAQCGLLGDYDHDTRSCTCDPGWAGPNCTLPSLAAAALPLASSQAYLNLSAQSWGGGAIRDTDGTYSLFAAAMTWGSYYKSSHGGL